MMQLYTYISAEFQPSVGVGGQGWFQSQTLYIDRTGDFKVLAFSFLKIKPLQVYLVELHISLKYCYEPKLLKYNIITYLACTICIFYVYSLTLSL